jgi:hypothetical protein
MKQSSIFKWAGLAVVVILGYAAYRLLWTAVEPKVEQRVGQIGLTPNEVAANGPLPGDVSRTASNR